LTTLAVDTSEARGSVALLRSGLPVAVKRHDANSDYSEWLLPAVEDILARASAQLRDVDLLAVASGPGSFTGLRVGLTTVKAWAEVYGKRVVGVPRLEAIARSRGGNASGLVAACYDAQRGQIFGALYRCSTAGLATVEGELVISPEEFVSWVGAHAGPVGVNWVSLDPQLITSLPGWNKRLACGDAMNQCLPELATEIGRLAEDRARSGLFTDPLQLDANYVRRSDAEIFWKGR